MGYKSPWLCRTVLHKTVQILVTTSQYCVMTTQPMSLMALMCLPVPCVHQQVLTALPETYIPTSVHGPRSPNSAQAWFCPWSSLLDGPWTCVVALSSPIFGPFSCCSQLASLDGYWMWFTTCLGGGRAVEGPRYQHPAQWRHYAHWSHPQLQSHCYRGWLTMPCRWLTPIASRIWVTRSV